MVKGVTSAHHEEVGGLLVVSSDFSSSSDSRSEAATCERQFAVYMYLTDYLPYGTVPYLTIAISKHVIRLLCLDIVARLRHI